MGEPAASTPTSPPLPEYFLFSKNLLYLNGLANAFAPDINLLAEVGPVFSYFQTKYPAEMTRILLGSLTSGPG